MMERAKKLETDALKKEIKALKDQRLGKNVSVIKETMRILLLCNVMLFKRRPLLVEAITTTHPHQNQVETTQNRHLKEALIDVHQLVLQMNQISILISRH
jgi:hypothetical protein